METVRKCAGKGQLARCWLGRVVLAIALLLQVCSGAAAGAGVDAAPPSNGSQACTAYGDPPRPTVASSEDGTLNAMLDTVLNACAIMAGEVLDWTDANGTPRQACLVAPRWASTARPLPLLVWLHPTLVAQDAILVTGLPQLVRSGNLSGNPLHPGFILLLPAARDIEQFLPAPLNAGIGWDHWYRNLDRSSPDLNVDVAAIDHFVQVTEQRGIVDPKRVYVSGWSEGADMATLYGLNTPGVAATAVYSTITPFADPADPCPGPAFASNSTRPYYLMVRECDTGDACPAGQEFLDQLRSGVLAPELVHGVILNSGTRPVTVCNRLCTGNSPLAQVLSQQQHTHWPLQWNNELFAFLRDNPEP
ncbi:MAG: hypothetical protein P4L83_17355 [Nevskia sp.]|nr:hypothetical protein [Nevskia sp.]